VRRGLLHPTQPAEIAGYRITVLLPAAAVASSTLLPALAC
jgi:hypothetical protein